LPTVPSPKKPIFFSILISRGEVIKTFSYINPSGAQNNPEIAGQSKKFVIQLSGNCPAGEKSPVRVKSSIAINDKALLTTDGNKLYVNNFWMNLYLYLKTVRLEGYANAAEKIRRIADRKEVGHGRAIQ
jgi:hypothetical protein